MYLFSRTTRLSGGQGRRGVEWAMGMAERVNAGTDLEVGLWGHAYSAGVGTIAWTAFVPDMGVLEAANDKLLADDSYVGAVDQGAALTEGGVDDLLAQVVYGEPDPEREIRYVTSVQSVCANGQIARGIEVGVEIAQRAEAIIGPTMFVTSVTGPYGGVGWLTGFEDVHKMAAAQQALAADEKFLQLVDKEAAKTYAEDPAASVQTIWRRQA
jgi:hypothetical protein